VSAPVIVEARSSPVPYGVEVTLVNPYTYRAEAIANVTGLLAVTGLIALAVAIVVAAMLARRFTTPLRRLTEASRDLAEGDLARRVPSDAIEDGPIELSELGLQFNAMAQRLQRSVEIIRRDRDRSREFLADVSHELRTPIAALRTFNELLTEGAADDPAARAEFLETSRAQLERLDWLAQNLLELSKLDSGLVLLDLRPEDLRSAVEQAVEQAAATARRRGVELTMERPAAPIQIRHDPVRIGQVVANLVGNGVKFTPRGGSVKVQVQDEPDGGASITVADTGIGIDAAELPRIFDRFFRGSRATEARGSGSGLGLAIVRSIVEMHGGTVSVESRLGAGSTFRVVLPELPRPPISSDSQRVA
jgi:two-component system sensor histidine kinase BaeS